MNLNPPTEHQLLVFWVGLLVILVAARLLGTLMQRIGQPAVVGELAAGLIIGPSVLGRVAPDVFDWLFPADDVQTAMLFTVGWLGVLLLLVATGFETDLGLIGRLGRAATLVSAGSLIVPALAGFAVGWFIPSAFLGEGTERYIFALFIAAALSISSLPVIAKILSEMGLMRRNFGQLTLAAGMANDVVGWIALGFIAGLAQAGGVKFDKLAITLGGLVIFFGFAFTLGQRAVDSALRRVRANGDDPLAGLSVILVTALTFGVITQWLHVEAVLGAFVAGVILARSRFGDHGLIQPLETMTAAVFAPVFFATAGLRVDLGLLADMETLAWGAIVLGAASISKFVGSILGARLSLLPTREGAALGVGLNARGALEIVIATVGLSLGVLNERSYTVIVLMAMATSMLAPPLLRRVLAGWQGDPEERRRIDLENQLDSNAIVTSGRVLIPTTGGLSSIVAAQIVGLTWPESTEIQLLTVGDEPVDLDAVRNVLPGRTVEHFHRPGTNIADAILDESRLGYAAIVIGSDANRSAPHLVSPLVDDVVNRATIPAVVVRRPNIPGLPWAFSRAVLPLSGSEASRGAQEIGAYLSANIGTHLHQLHIATGASPLVSGLLRDHAPRQSAVRHIVNAASDFATRLGANHTTIVESGENAGDSIVRTAGDVGADIVILSGTSRTGGGDLFLGHTIHHVLDRIDATVVVAITPGPERDGTESLVESSESTVPA
ncbi:MAG: universal stress protein [Acidimicrobiales bacterium]|nr:universal stress protein [Acidimicrobiales bacterium]